MEFEDVKVISLEQWMADAPGMPNQCHCNSSFSLNRIRIDIHDISAWDKMLRSRRFASRGRSVNTLTHLHLDKMAAILQPTFSNAFS